MPWFKFILSRKKSILAGSLFVLFLFQFNNCSKNISQMGSSTSLSSTSQNLTANNQADTPVNSRNPFVLQCINSSDGTKINSSLSRAVKVQKMQASGKISSLDWNQDTDLVVVMDNRCVIDSNFNDSMLNYIKTADIKAELKFSVHTIKKEDVSNLKLFLDRASESECLAAAEKNETLKIQADVADPKLSNMIHLTSMGATDAVIASVLAYNSGSLYKTKVAVLDTGIDYTNPELAEQMARDSAGNIIGYNSTGKSTALTDSSYHGTHVTGLIAGGFRNGIGGSGIYGRNIAIYPIRATNNGDTFELADVASGIIWAADNGMDIINLSLGTPSPSVAIKTAIEYAMSKNVVIVVAAGNDGKKLSTAFPMYPAMYSAQFSGLITVSSLDIANVKNPTLSYFSNYSSTYVDVLAPGSNGSEGIYSTLPMNRSTNSTAGFGSKFKDTDGSYTMVHGTSMATPLVTGALAAAISIAKAKSKNFTNAELKTFVRDRGSLRFTDFKDFSSNGNSLNFASLLNAVKYEIEKAPAVVTPDPTLSISSQPVNRQAVADEKVELNVDVSGDAPLSYQWYKNGIPVSGANSKKLTITNLTSSEVGTYYVVVSSDSLSVNSQSVTLKMALRYCTQ